MTDTFSKNLSLLRNRKGISINDLAESLNISHHTLRNIEYLSIEPKASLLLRICDYFEINDLRGILTEKMN